MLRVKPVTRGLAPLLALLIAPAWVLPAGGFTPPEPDPVIALAAEPFLETPRRGAVRVDRSSRSRTARTTSTVFVGADGEHVTAARLAAYLESKGSPMRRHAGALVTAGIAWRVDPRVVVAIAGAESDFGRAAYGFNAWGWGSVRYWSWPNAIDRFTKAIALAYPSMRYGDFTRAARRYNPVNPPAWARKVSAYFRAI